VLRYHAARIRAWGVYSRSKCAKAGYVWDSGHSSPPQGDRRCDSYYDLHAISALLVEGVENGGPAERAGLRERDLVVRFDGQPVSGVDDLHRLLTAERSGVAAEIEVIRGTDLRKLIVVPQSPRE